MLEPGMRTVPIGIDAIQGLRRASNDFGVRGRVVAPAVREPFKVTLSRLAAQRYDLILAAGLVAQDAAEAAAANFPARSSACSTSPSRRSGAGRRT
ncbi:MAG: hypothetical protein ACM3QU_06350 [Verrucomicrobiota bacterium]